MTFADDYARVRALGARLDIAREKVEQYITTLAYWDWWNSIELRLDFVFARN